MKTKLFSLTSKDFTWQPLRGSGPGGQHRNKVYTGMRCTHEPSGAVGVATDSRSQKQNRQAAFKRCVESKKFQKWLRIEVAKRSGELAQIEEQVNREMKRVKVEVREDGRWVADDAG